MLAMKTYEQSAVFDPTNPYQRVRALRGGMPGGWTSYYFNRVPNEASLGGISESWAGLPQWAQIGAVAVAAAAAGYFGMQRFGNTLVKPALRKVGINLAGPRVRRRRRR